MLISKRLLSIRKLLAFAVLLPDIDANRIKFGEIEKGEWIERGPAGIITLSGTTTIDFARPTTRARALIAPVVAPIVDTSYNASIEIPNPPDLAALPDICVVSTSSTSTSTSSSTSSTSSSTSSTSSSTSSASSSVSSTITTSSTKSISSSASISQSAPTQSASDESEEENEKSGGESGEGGGLGGLGGLLSISGNALGAAVGAAAGALGAAAFASLTIPNTLSNASVAQPLTNYYMPPGSSSMLPNAKIPSTQSWLTWDYGFNADPNDFANLLDLVQIDVNNGKGPLDGAPYTTSSGSLKFNYTVVPGAGHNGTDAFPGVVSLFEWFRFNGGSNYVTGDIITASNNLSAVVGLWSTTDTILLCCFPYNGSFPGG